MSARFEISKLVTYCTASILGHGCQKMKCNETKERRIVRRCGIQCQLFGIHLKRKEIIKNIRKMEVEHQLRCIAVLYFGGIKLSFDDSNPANILVLR